MNTKRTAKVEIKVIKGDNPCAILITDGEVTYAIEEKKINDKSTDYPHAALDLIRAIAKINDNKFKELKTDKIILDSKNKYLGLEYSKEYNFSVAKNEGVYYKQYLHDPNDPKFTTPGKFFNDVSKLIDSGLKVAWFQKRWMYGDSIDFNRCIIQNNELEFNVEDNGLFNELMSKCKQTNLRIDNFEAYNPKDAIKKLKEKEIDVLVIGNLILTNKEETLCPIQ